MKPYLAAAAMLAALSSSPTHAQVSVEAPWVRATVPGQKATGAFMTLRSSQDARFVEARSPVAGVVEIHEMKHDGGMMRMSAIASLPLPAGRHVDLKPGGYHVMLMDLKRPIADGDAVPLTLVFEGADRKRVTMEVTAKARPLASEPPKHAH